MDGNSLHIHRELSLNVLCHRIAGLCEEIIGVIKFLEEDLFVKTNGKNSSVGAHFRHIYERMECVILGLESGVIEYDSRKRDVNIETKPNIAIEKFQYMKSFFEKLDNINRDLLIIETAGINAGKITLNSNFEREILYLIDHTTHHLAVVKILLEQFDVQLDSDLGKAASTIIYEKSQCAQ